MFQLSAEEVLQVRSTKRNGMALNILRYALARGPQGVTCAECAQALGIKGSSASVRFSELVGSGCLESTGARRRTSYGGSAQVFVVPKDADFHNFLSYSSSPKGKARILSKFEVAVLSAVKSHLKKWDSRAAPEVRQKQLKKLFDDIHRANHHAKELVQQGKGKEPRTPVRNLSKSNRSS